MTTPSGTISLSNVNTELGFSPTALITMNDAAVRTLAGVGGSGTPISMQNLQNKSNAFLYTISSNTNNLNLRSGALSAGWNGTLKVIATINNGVVISSSSTGSYALTVDGSWPGGVDLVNNGVIVGRGGNGGDGARINNFPNSNMLDGSPGTSGGPALTVSSAVTVNNTNGIIGGGGGGGGGGRAIRYDGKGFSAQLGGGGGGGITSGSGGTGGSGGGWGFFPAGNGEPGSLTSAGGGGYGGGGNGGNGGSYGSSGQTGQSNGSGNVNRGPYPGGAAGAAIVGNSNISYAGPGTINGSVS